MRSVYSPFGPLCIQLWDSGGNLDTSNAPEFLNYDFESCIVCGGWRKGNFMPAMCSYCMGSMRCRTKLPGPRLAVLTYLFYAVCLLWTWQEKTTYQISNTKSQRRNVKPESSSLEIFSAKFKLSIWLLQCWRKILSGLYGGRCFLAEVEHTSFFLNLYYLPPRA